MTRVYTRIADDLRHLEDYSLLLSAAQVLEHALVHGGTVKTEPVKEMAAGTAHIELLRSMQVEVKRRTGHPASG